jgi:hypothetical protein
VCKREKEREKERKNREKIKFFIIIFEENRLPPKIKKNAMLAGHRAGHPIPVVLLGGFTSKTLMNQLLITRLKLSIVDNK